MAYTHFGSTSQDVIDTAMAQVTRNAMALVETDLSRAIDALFDHAAKHATTPMLARTLMQPASVTSFGFKCAGWAAPGCVRSRPSGLRVAKAKPVRSTCSLAARSRHAGADGRARGAR